MHTDTYVRDISTLRITDAEEAGGKGANMGELVSAKLPVPPGFVLLRDCYRHSMQAGGVDAELNALHREALENVADTTRLTDLCQRMQGLVQKAGIPDSVRDLILDSYHTLGSNSVVAVRSSATGEDGSDASFAGMNATITNVSGDDDLIDSVVRCWMSLFSPRVITYRASRKFTADPAMAVVMQQMVNSDKAGVAFTADPSTGARDRVVIEAAFGLGEVVVSGEVEPDTYIVSKETLEVLDVRLGLKSFKIVRGPDGHDHSVDLNDQDAGARVLDDAELRTIAELAIATERHNGCPQDTEWAISSGKSYLVQARPITTLRHTTAPTTEANAVLARGLAAAPGMASGKVRVLQTPDEGDRLLEGEILVAQMTNPDWLPTIRRAAALVTNTGGMTCHAAIVARELGVPCVVGTRTATRDLHDGTTVTVDGAHGRVLSGRVEQAAAASTQTTVGERTASAEPRDEVTGTKVYVNLAMPDTAEKVAAQGPDGVGLLRAEFMLTEAFGGRHPRDLIAHGEQKALVAGLVTPLSADRHCFLAPARHISRNRLPHQRVPRSQGRRRVRTSRAQSDDRLSRLLPVRQGTRPVRPRAAGAGASAGAVTQCACDDPVRAHPLGTRGVPVTGGCEPAGPAARAAPLGDGRGSVGRALAARVHRHGCRRSVHRQQRSHTVGARSGPRFRCLRRTIRRIRPGGARHHRSDHRHRTQIRHHLVTVWTGTVDQPRVRGAPGSDGHHVGVGESGRTGCRPADNRRGRTAVVAGISTGTTDSSE